MKDLLMDITLRNAKEDDCQTMYEWRNHPQVREGSISPDEITWSVHQEWFARSLHSANRKLLIASHGEEPVGVLRFDLNNHLAEISIYLVPKLIGKGYGQHLLHMAENWLKKHHPEVSKMVAKILAENQRSQKVFLKAGFTPFLVELHKDI